MNRMRPHLRFSGQRFCSASISAHLAGVTASICARAAATAFCATARAAGFSRVRNRPRVCCSSDRSRRRCPNAPSHSWHRIRSPFRNRRSLTRDCSRTARPSRGRTRSAPRRMRSSRGSRSFPGHNIPSPYPHLFTRGSRTSPSRIQCHPHRPKSTQRERPARFPPIYRDWPGWRRWIASQNTSRRGWPRPCNGRSTGPPYRPNACRGRTG